MVFAATAVLWALMGAEPSIPPCKVRPLPVDMARLHAMKDVQAVNGDESTSVVTVLFSNGDVLRLGANDSGCTSGLVISARFWSYNLIGESNAVQKATYVTDLIFSPQLAEQFDHSIQTSKLTTKPGQWYFDGPIEGGAVWWASVTTVSGLDGMGRSMSIGYTFPSGKEELSN
jgi:hypothetical protein